MTKLLLQKGFRNSGLHGPDPMGLAQSKTLDIKHTQMKFRKV